MTQHFLGLFHSLLLILEQFEMSTLALTTTGFVGLILSTFKNEMAEGEYTLCTFWP
jgi:hypothetical protein